MISFDDINWVAVLIGVVLSNALGFLLVWPAFWQYVAANDWEKQR